MIVTFKRKVFKDAVHLHRDDSGASMIEYGLGIALISIGSIAALTSTGDDIQSLIGASSGVVEQANDGTLNAVNLGSTLNLRSKSTLHGDATYGDLGEVIFNGKNSYAELEPMEVGGPMEMSIDVQMDKNVKWERMINYADAPGKAGIILARYSNTDRAIFEIQENNKSYRIVSPPGTLVLGEKANWKAAVDENGYMKLYKNGAVVAEGQGYVPQRKVRKDNFIGKSSYWQDPADSYGSRANLDVKMF